MRDMNADLFYSLYRVGLINENDWGIKVTHNSSEENTEYLDILILINHSGSQYY